MREKIIEAHLVKRVQSLGGEVRKVRWIGRNGAPDRLVMLPYTPHAWGYRPEPFHFYLELKAPGEKLRPSQAREHACLNSFGLAVETADSISAVERLLA